MERYDRDYSREKIIKQRGCRCEKCGVKGRIYDKAKYVDERLRQSRGPRDPCACNGPKLFVHHKIRLQDGGTHNPNNLIVLCPKCHTKIHRENGHWNYMISINKELYLWLKSFDDDTEKALYKIRQQTEWQ